MHFTQSILRPLCKCHRLYSFKYNEFDIRKHRVDFSFSVTIPSLTSNTGFKIGAICCSDDYIRKGDLYSLEIVLIIMNLNIFYCRLVVTNRRDQVRILIPVLK